MHYPFHWILYPCFPVSILSRKEIVCDGESVGRHIIPGRFMPQHLHFLEASPARTPALAGPGPVTSYKNNDLPRESSVKRPEHRYIDTYRCREDKHSLNPQTGSLLQDIPRTCRQAVYYEMCTDNPLCQSRLCATYTMDGAKMPVMEGVEEILGTMTT